MHVSSFYPANTTGVADPDPLSCWLPTLKLTLDLHRDHDQGGDLRTALWTDDIEGTFEWGWHQRGRAAAVDIAEGLDFLHSNGIVHR